MIARARGARPPPRPAPPCDDLVAGDAASRVNWAAECHTNARPRAKWHGHAGMKWHADEDSLQVDGCWCCPYRAIDRDGNLIKAFPSEKSDMAAAERFFAALDVAGHAPTQHTTDKHDSYPRHPRDAGAMQ